ncbi:tetratricopeptide repeat protein [Tropicimonas sp. S265A]|uniref:tetratricopeptide repeat protein n=1 Tax=Tropicimonas sp. S265A TaxID=3415134 RepID=UPI003C7A9035
MLRQARFALGFILAAATGATGLPAAADGLAGAYLAGRQASIASDYQEAARYFARALMRDRDNPVLMESAALAFLGMGDIAQAYPIALKLIDLDPRNQVASLVLAADTLGPEGDIDAELPSVGPAADGLIEAWRALDRGETDEAFAAFDALIEDRRLQGFGTYHKALALAQVGDFEGADALLSADGGEAAFFTRRGILAHAQVMSQLGRFDEASLLIAESLGTEDPRLRGLIADLASETPVPFDIAPTPQAGYAEVFYTVAMALSGQAADAFTLLYARVAQHISPGHVDAILLAAELLEELEQYDLANKAYDKVPRDDPAFLTAEIGRANVLRADDKGDAAIEVLRQLTETHSDVGFVHTALGDALRRMERFEESADAYDQAIAMISAESPRDWVLYYARGIAHERIDDWDAAESDLRKALELNPGQPMVLNYLGYSFLELGTNFDEAMGMIEEAVAARPDNGYITDSLGWGLYRLGRFEEAVAPMEKAVELEPLDPIINDHLGDVYYAVGRKLEAEFQWRRALSFDPEPEEAERIRRKLDVGLDQVLIEEGEEPVSVANEEG